MLSLAQLIERIAGLTLERGGMSATIDRHVGERMRVLGLRRVEDYIALASSPGPEQRLLIDAVTVRFTWFFRDEEQLEVIQKLIAATSEPVSIWVAGCATGEEAYTIAMIGRGAGRNVRVLATDVNESALEVARRGVYSAAAAEYVPEPHRHWLVPGEDGFAIDPRLGSSVSFERHNLVDLPPRGEWDIVVCRNVLIYFAQNAAARVHERFALAVRPGGSLVLGAGEIVVKPPAGFEMASEDNRLVLRRSGGALSRTSSSRASSSSVTSSSPRTSSPPSPPSRGTTPPTSPPSRGTTPPTSPPSRGTTPPTSPPSRGATPPTSPPSGALPSGSQPRRPAQPAPVRAQASATPGGLPPVPRSVTPAPREAAPAGVDDLATALGRGHALFERGETSAAIAVYAELAVSHASVAEVWLFLGIARYAQGDMENAAVALRASHCLDAGLWPAVFYLWRALERTGHHAEARRMYELLATNSLQPFELQSVSAMINELRAFQHDFQTAGRLAAERDARAFRDPWPPRRGT